MLHVHARTRHADRLLLLAIAAAIFAFDTLTSVAMAAAVLYVIVVLLSVNSFRERDLVAVGLGCMGLTVVSFVLTHASHYEEASLGRCLVSLIAIGTTTLLAFRMQRAKDALHRAHAELAHMTRLTTLGELAASIVHEVRQPISAVVTDGDSCLRWLGREPPEMGEVKACVGRMIANARRTDQVVVRLRALARQETAEQSSVSLDEIVQDVIPIIERELRSHSVRLELALGAGTPVNCDRIQLQQVVLNLMVNAIQSMAQTTDAERVLSVRTTARHQADRAGSCAVIEIRDTGAGFAPDAIPQLFAPFYTTKPQGIGMGLPICRSIVEAHGGRITAMGLPEGGASFTVAIPVFSPERQTWSPAAVQAEPV